MNYNNLQHYTTAEQVYSNDLNQILSKTPPRLFKWGLIAFGFCLLAAVIAATMIRQAKTVSLDYIAYAKDNQLVLTCFASKKDFDQLARSRTGIIKSPRDANGNIPTEKVRIDSVSALLFYEAGGQRFADAAAVANASYELNQVTPRYKLSIYTTPSKAAAFFTGTGQVQLIVSEYRLIEKIFGFKR